jgi:hypothetical protein
LQREFCGPLNFEPPSSDQNGRLPGRHDGHPLDASAAGSDETRYKIAVAIFPNAKMIEESTANRSRDDQF